MNSETPEAYMRRKAMLADNLGRAQSDPCYLGVNFYADGPTTQKSLEAETEIGPDRVRFRSWRNQDEND